MSQRIAIIGAGWAGLAAAVRAVQEGHQVTVFEASRTPGGRARAVAAAGGEQRRDNGQHILIGAYTDTLRLMRLVGVDPDAVLLRLPLTLTFPQGDGLTLPDWPSPWDVLAGIVRARGWTWADRLGLLRTALGWQMAGFQCPPTATVADLCRALPPAVRDGFIDPLCVSALNTPAQTASGAVFLRVLKDALFSVPGGSRLLLPRTDLGALFPAPAVAWLRQHGATVRLGERVTALAAGADSWQIDGARFDQAIIASSSTEAARIVAASREYATNTIANQLTSWATLAQSLHFEAITTVYAQSPQGLRQPMLALHSHATRPAQFVFDRGQLTGGIGGPAGLLAFVVSASTGDNALIESQVVAQARQQLGLTVQPLQTITEKRATFACTPQLQRPAQAIAPGLSACGDYVEGPYPATLEGAVRSGWAAAGLTT